MSKSIQEHEGKKYLRRIVSPTTESYIEVDVYAVLVAFDVTCPAIAHCIKKLLACGTRGKGNKLDDLIGAEAALSRAIDLEKQRIKNNQNCDIPNTTSATISTGGKENIYPYEQTERK